MRINFDAGKTGLPVVQIIPSVKEHLFEHNTLILSAAPGAGKSTVLPLALLNEPWLEGRKILMLEPRRLAAGTIAVRMASLLNEQVGHTVGYRVRFESKVSAQTRIEVVTEGILTRMLQDDNALEEVGLVIFDEFHERSINTDIALALCRESQLILRPDLKILVMSATLDTKRLSDILFAAVVESTGALFPVEKICTGGQDLASLPTLAAKMAIRALEEKEGDILVFLPGQGEILKCEGLLKDLGVKALIRPLYGQLSFSDQNAAIMPDPDGRRKIVLATSIAETSLTIEGIRIVIDSGFARSAAFDPRTGLSGLRTAPISLDSAEQRAGRAGRLSSGVCYRMWSLADQERMEDYRTPEIQEADLAPLVLEMLKWGVNDIMRLTWLTPPPASSLERAKDLLSQLGAMRDGRITGHGKQIHALPCHPRLAHMLLMASDDDLLPLATDVAALLEERDPLDRASSIDINLRIEALRRYRGENRKERRMDNIEKIAASYRRMLRAYPDNGTVDPYATGLLLSYAFPERIACLRPEQTGQFKLANGKMAAVNADDDLAHEPWLVIAQLDARQGMGKAFLAAPLNPRDLYLIAQEKNNITWDTRKGGLIASRDRLVGSILLESRPIRFVPDEQVVLAVSNALRTEGETLLCFTDETEQWQNRVLSLRSWRRDEEWPDVSIPALLASIDGWLSPYLSQIRKVDDLRRLDLVTILQHRLSYEQQQALDSLAPAAIKVPSGSWIKLKYSADGEAPVLSVRLQEVFGMLDTPRVNGGRQGVVLHLLSPGFKPVQVTSDLRSFWENTYFEVRKELKRRYPKHSWPEEPLKAEAVSGVKRKK